MHVVYLPDAMEVKSRHSWQTIPKCVFFFFLWVFWPAIAPPGIDPLEHEEVPMAVHKRAGGAAVVVRATTGGRLGTFGQVVELSQTLPVSGDESVRLYQARMDNKDVVLRVLKGASATGCHKKKQVQDQFRCLSTLALVLMREKNNHSYLKAILWPRAVVSP